MGICILNVCDCLFFELIGYLFFFFYYLEKKWYECWFWKVGIFWGVICLFGLNKFIIDNLKFYLIYL